MPNARRHLLQAGLSAAIVHDIKGENWELTAG